MAWRPAKCLITLRDEINAAYPNRVKAQDGIIGDEAHQARKSDHNPDSHGVVHAIDVDARGIPVDSIVNHLHGLALAGDQRLAGGYLIWNRHIASAAHGWVWRDYTGADPHNLHFHMSCTYDPACDWTAPWGITTDQPAPLPKPQPQEDDMDVIVEVTDDNNPVFYFVSPTEYTEIGNTDELKQLQSAFTTKQMTAFDFAMVTRSRKHNPR